MCCSKRCRVTLNNRNRSKARHAAARAKDPRCAFCGGAIHVPDSGRIRAKYCSYECKSRALAVRWRAKSPGYMRGYLYGLTDERYQALLAAQGGVCAVCGTSEWAGKTGKPNVDHDHGCDHPGKGALSCPDCVRGLLCDSCNRGIGMLGEDPTRLRAAADYLERAMSCAI